MENNCITKLSTIYLLDQFKEIVELDFQGNPVTKVKKYQMSVIDRFKSLVYLDNKRITIQALNMIRYHQNRAIKGTTKKKIKVN